MHKLFLIILLMMFESFAAGGDILLIDESTLSQQISTKARDEKKILIFFTSWCPHCKNAVMQLARDFPQDDRIFFISLDKDFKKLSASKDHYPDDMKIYFLTSPDDIRGIFTTFKIKYSNSVPHISILDSNNEILKDNATIRQAIRYLK